MKWKKLYLLLGSILFLFSFSSAEVKDKKGDNFLRVNPNITNEELRLEMEKLRNEFEGERQKIQDIYQNRMQALKAERKAEIKALKQMFGDRRETLMNNYGGERRGSYDKKDKAVKPESTITPKSKPSPVKNKQGTDKKDSRKPY